MYRPGLSGLSALCAFEICFGCGQVCVEWNSMYGVLVEAPKCVFNTVCAVYYIERV